MVVLLLVQLAIADARDDGGSGGRRIEAPAAKSCLQLSSSLAELRMKKCG